MSVVCAHNIHEQGGIIIIVVVTGRSDDLRNRAKRYTMGTCVKKLAFLPKQNYFKGQLISEANSWSHLNQKRNIIVFFLFSAIRI